MESGKRRRTELRLAWRALAVLAVTVAAPSGARSADKGWDPLIGIVGAPAPPWEGLQWPDANPLMLEKLRGKVVLIRWWTGTGCPYCEASIPILNRLHEAYAKKGLVVLGFYHHKSDEPLTASNVRDAAGILGIRFPIAIDPGWANLKRYWLERVESQYTSVSFLIDRQGVVREVHPGGTITEEDGQRLEALIASLLKKGQAP